MDNKVSIIINILVIGNLIKVAVSLHILKHGVLACEDCHWWPEADAALGAVGWKMLKAQETLDQMWANFD